jgi:ATP adenylyltransferase
MDRLYAPWRTDYVRNDKTDNKEIKGCVFCHIAKNYEDESLYVLHKDKDCFVVMNKYPYSPGHFMIIPDIHTDKLEELDLQTWLRMNELVQQGVAMLKDVMRASGVNIGMNLGQLAGAGIAEHIHMHLVPRWMADTNFITTIGDTRVYSTDFDDIFQKLKEATKKYFK